MSEEKHREARKNLDDAFEERLHKEYIDIEEEYHAAYPDRPMPYTSSVFTAIFSRYGKGFLLWGLVGAIVAAGFWVLYALVYER